MVPVCTIGMDGPRVYNRDGCVKATQPTRQLLTTLSNSEMNQTTTQLRRTSTIPKGAQQNLIN